MPYKTRKNFPPPHPAGRSADFLRAGLRTLPHGGFPPINHEPMDPSFDSLLRLQRDEITLYEVYRRLAAAESDPARQQVLLRLADDERRHCAVLRNGTGRDVAPDPKRVFWYVRMARMLGLAYVVRRMERCERGAEACYARYVEREEFRRIALEERRHGEELTLLAGAIPLSYMSSVVLGLNDALVEFTGALAGFTLALGAPRLVALTGGITGIAAALSMAASEYLSTRTGRACGKSPLRAAVCTGIAYLVTVALLVVPYLLFADALLALGMMLLLALAIIAAFNHYYAVVRSDCFRHRFWEMTLLSFGIAGIGFGIGYLLKILAGIDL